MTESIEIPTLEELSARITALRDSL